MAHPIRQIVGGMRMGVGVFALLAAPIVCAATSNTVQTATNAVRTVTLLVTGYCNCSKCCGWEMRGFWWWRKPVYAYGPLKGKRKQVGVTASGKTARHGTIAADPKVFKFGTKMRVPGYGTGVVQDVGGAIKGQHIDIWFSDHTKAKRWGKRRLNVQILP